MPIARIRMPRMGTSVHESTVVAWRKSAGERVSKGEALLSAESDKVEFEVEAPADGTLREILVSADETVPVGAALATLETEEEIADDAPDEGADDWAAPVAPLKPRKKPAVPAARKREAPAPAGGKKTWLSPRVQALAAAHGIAPDALGRIRGTGAGGRVRARDVEAFLAAGGAAAQPTAAPAYIQPSAPITMSAAPLSPDREERVEPLGAIRKRIARNLARSAREIPQVTSWLDVDMSAVSAFREARKEAFLARHGCRLTFAPFFAMAIVHALRSPENARFNAAFEDDALVVKRFVNLSVAVDAPGGLMVPVLESADSLGFVELCLKLDDLAARAREGTLAPEELRGGTITLTNFGASGALGGNPLINPPETAIIGTGAVAPRVAALPGGAIAVRPVMTLAITFDHRANDGMAAGRFASDVRAALENMNLSSLPH